MLWPSTRVPGFVSVNCVPGFVSVNCTGELKERAILAHELGHGTHKALAAQAQTDNSLEQGITTAGIPSTFAELLLVEHLLSTDEALGRALLARALDQAVGVAHVASTSTTRRSGPTGSQSSRA